MAEYTEDELYDMSDDELQEAVDAVRAEDSGDESEESEDEDNGEDEQEQSDESEELEKPEEGPDGQPEQESNDDEENDEDAEDENELDSGSENEDNDQSEKEEEEQSEEDENEGIGKKELEDEEDKSKDATKSEDSGYSKEAFDKFMSESTTVRADGVDQSFTNREKIEQFDKMYPKAVNFHRKTQALKPWAKSISALEDENMTAADVNMMIDVMKGDKAAIAEIVKKAGIDPVLDLDPAEVPAYQAKDYGKNESELNLIEIDKRISGDKEYAITKHVLNNQWDERSQDMAREDPSIVESLHSQIRNGDYDIIAPRAMKLKFTGDGNKSDIEYYNEAVGLISSEMRAKKEADTANEAKVKADSESEAKAKSDKVEADRKVEASKVSRAKAKTAKQKEAKEKSVNRKAATISKTKSSSKKITDYLDVDDDTYKEWYKSMEDNL